MNCSHGLNKINCPICRVSSFSTPKFNSKIHELYKNELKPMNPHIERNKEKKKDFKRDLKQRNTQDDTPLLKNLNKINFNLNPIPNFQNRMFEERMKEIDIINSNNFEYLKKKEIIDPVFKFLKEQNKT